MPACLLGSDASAFTISIVCVFITFLLLLLLTILFRFRWHMRLWLYEACRGRHHSRRMRGRHFRYDVFVSYAEENSPWVVRELLPRLVEEWGLRLCVHQRDFVPGKHIVDNIADCVSLSGRVLLVFSPDFGSSEWCQFELKFCQACVMERDDIMVLAMMQGTEARHLTGAMMAVLRTTSYLEWAEHRDARASFWGRLRLALEVEEPGKGEEEEEEAVGLDG
ncbi:toll-like receptor 2 type-2 [Babylonia areolata]|uniref:toll-like receptor 2 type-2 n=1 Tax=Babylonia areolata TaxID=304850 RepID=UPI003FD4EE23